MLQIKNTLGGGKPEGLYAWKKNEYIPEQTIVNPTFHIKANVSTQKAIITSDNINFKAFGTLTDSNNFYQSRESEFCNFMNGFNNSNSSVNFAISTSTYSGQLELNYLNNSYWNAFTKMTPTDTGAELTASNLFKTTIDDTLQYTGTKTIAAKIGDIVGYVVSDKETAYPDGGEKGGYWYERVNNISGTDKIIFDTINQLIPDAVKALSLVHTEEITPASDSDAILHSYVGTPNHFILTTEDFDWSNSYVLAVTNITYLIIGGVAMRKYILSGNKAVEGNVSSFINITSTAIKNTQNSYRFIAGHTYKLYVFA